MKILIVSAHYDDFELGCGGTILKHIEKGDEVHLAITSSDEHRTGDMLDRYKEQEKSATIIGIDMGNVYRFSYHNIIDNMHNIIGELDCISPDLVFTQYKYDTHQDHQRASLIGQAVGRKRNITTLFYDSGSSYDFNPNVYSLINWSMKLKLLECYKTQIEREAIRIDILKKKNAYWASLITDVEDAFAEGFVVRKMIYEI